MLRPGASPRCAPCTCRPVRRRSCTPPWPRPDMISRARSSARFRTRRMTAEQAPIVHLYKIALHDVRCLGNSFSTGAEDFPLPRKTLSGCGWRRRWDSNPRDPSGPTPLAGERLRPLGHVSADGSTILSNSKTSGKYKKPSLFTICSFLHPQLTRNACTFALHFLRNSIQTTRPDIGNKSNV